MPSHYRDQVVRSEWVRFLGVCGGASLPGFNGCRFKGQKGPSSLNQGRPDLDTKRVKTKEIYLKQRKGLVHRHKGGMVGILKRG